MPNHQETPGDSTGVDESASALASANRSRLSALVDDELDDAEADALIASVLADDDERESWNTYHLIGDVLRGTRAAPVAREAFAARLAAEPPIVARRKPLFNPVRRAERMRLSAAAAVAAVAFVGWVAMPRPAEPDSIATTDDPKAVIPASSATPPVSGTITAASVEPPANVDDYLIAHQRYSASSLMQGSVPYVRLVVETAPGLKSGAGR